MDAEEKKSYYNPASPVPEGRPAGFGLHSFPDISADEPENASRCLPSEETFQRIQYTNNGSGDSSISSKLECNGNFSAKGALSTAQLNEQAYQEGFAEGRKVGQIEAEKTWHELGGRKIEPLMISLQETLLQLHNIRQETYRQIEKEMVELSLAIARQIICREIELDKEIVFGVAREALAKAEDPGRVKIKMSPSDLKFVKESQSQLLSLIENIDNVTLEAAEGVQSGGCIIETDLGEIDARIEKQLQAVAESFQSAFKKP